MPIGISYYGNKRPAQGVKPHRTVTVPDNARKDLLPFGKPNPIDLMTGKHMVQFKPDTAVAASVEVADSVVRSESDDKIRLDGDAAAPGNDKLYGTDGTGAKGWRDAPSGLPSGTNGQVLKHNGTAWTAYSTVTLNVVTGVTYNATTHVLAFTYRQVTIIAYGGESSTTIETAVPET